MVWSRSAPAARSRCPPRARCLRTPDSTRRPSPPKRSRSPATSASTPTATSSSKNSDPACAPRRSGLCPRRPLAGKQEHVGGVAPTYAAPDNQDRTIPNKPDTSHATMTPREIVQEHDRNIVGQQQRSEEHTSELQSLMRLSYAVFSLKQKN